MRNILTFLCLSCFICAVQGQAIYYTNFNTLTGWDRNEPGSITLSSSNPSNYAGASGGNNVRFCDDDEDDWIRFTSPVISTLGKSDIVVGFGARRGDNWNGDDDEVMMLEYSVNGGSSWQTIDSEIWLSNDETWFWVTYTNLSPSLNNKSDVRFRFSYEANGSDDDECDDENFRIDDFTVGANLSLPIELKSFEVYPDAGRRIVELHWITATEKNNERFEVERSVDEGRTYEVISQVSGSGTISVEKSYTFEDRSAPCGTLAYRLRQIDYDGTFSFSPLRVVHLSCDMYLQPSLVKDELHIVWQNHLNPDNSNWQIIGVTGQLWREGIVTDIASGSLSIPVSDLPAGSYFFLIRAGSKSTILNFMKN